MRGTAIYAGVCALALALFLFVPHIDLLVSGLFYVSGRGFILSDWPPVVFLYRAVPWIAWGILALAAAGAFWLFLFQRPVWRFDRKALIFLVASTVLGPGLLANTLLKDHWGRARPAQIEAFGGPQEFTPAPLPADQCARNCAFVSGHAALGFSLVAFAFLLPRADLRRAATAAALAVGAVIGLGRIAQGAHFLSDVVFAGLLVYGTAALLYRWIVERDGLTTPRLRRLYRRLGHSAASAWVHGHRAFAGTTVCLILATAATMIAVALSIVFFDRPLALFFHHRDPDLHALFELTGRLGLTYGYLTAFGLAFGALHWGGSVPRLRPVADPMRAFSAIPAFLFTAIATSGVVVDVLKFILGRTRPKLLFAGGVDDFTWLGLRPDHWSFPSGHSATIVALAAALWLIWPRHVLFYMLVAALVGLSRVAVGAHYLSDVFAGALVAILATWGVASLFAKSGFDLARASRGLAGTGTAPPWPCRRFGRAPPTRHPAELHEAGPLVCLDGGQCNIPPKADRASGIGSSPWPCESKPSIIPAAETLSTRL
jgi:lipid A 4'-phosphatase